MANKTKEVTTEAEAPAGIELVDGAEAAAAGAPTGTLESEYELSPGLVQVNYV